MRRLIAFLTLYFLAVLSGHAQQVNLYCATGTGFTTWQPASSTNPCPITGSVTATVTVASDGAPGSAVPASANYAGINVAGTLRGWTGVNPTGTVYAAQVDLSSVAGTSIALGQALMAASIPVAIASNQSAIPASQSGTWTVQPGNTPNTTAWLVTSTPSAASGAAVTVSACTVLCANQVIKASAGNLHSFNVSADTTLSGAAWWIMIYDATSAPVDGTITPAKCYAMPIGTTSFSGAFDTPERFATGITIGVSTNGCFTKAASTHAFISAGYL